MQSNFIKGIGGHMEEADIAVRMAQDAVSRRLAEEQVALFREKQCTSILNIIQRNINETQRLA